MVVYFSSCLTSKIVQTWKAWDAASSYSPFLYFGYLKSVYWQTRFFVWQYNPVVAVVEDDGGDILMLAPLKRNIYTHAYKMLGDIRGCGETDFLFAPGLSDELKENCVLQFMKHVRGKIIFRRINSGSCVTKILRNHGYLSSVRETPCVKICFGDDIDAHIKTLSSSVRQNIRTAYNRMRRDSMSYELKVFVGENIMDSKVGKDIMNIYVKRQKLKYSKHKNLINLPFAFVGKFKYSHILHDSISLRRDGNAFHSVLYINGKAVSFMSGFADNRGCRVVIPRLAIDIDYGFYSPGYVMILETMRYLVANTNIRILDLSRGNEKYKLDLGGTSYSTDIYTCRV